MIGTRASRQVGAAYEARVVAAGMTPAWLTIPAAARLLGCSPDTAYHRAKRAGVRRPHRHGCIPAAWVRAQLGIPEIDHRRIADGGTHVRAQRRALRAETRAA